MVVTIYKKVYSYRMEGFGIEHAPPKRGRVQFQLRLGSLKSTRATLARLVRKYASGEIDRETFKDIVWALSQLVQVMKIEKDSNLEERLDEIERRIDG